MQRYKCAKMKLELGKGHTANGWQTLNLNPHLFTEKTVNVPQSLQKHQRGKRGARALDGNVKQWKGIDEGGLSLFTGLWAISGAFHRRLSCRDSLRGGAGPGVTGAGTHQMLRFFADEPWSRKSPSEDRRPGPQPCSSLRSLWFLRTRGRLPWESSRVDKLTPVSLPCGVSLRGIYARALRKTKFCGKFWAKQRFMVMGWVVPQRKGIPPGKGPLPGPVESLLLFRSEQMDEWAPDWQWCHPTDGWLTLHPQGLTPQRGTMGHWLPLLPTPAYRSFTTLVHTSQLIPHSVS